MANIIVNSAYNTIQNDNTFNNLSNTSIQAYNSKFTPYIGENIFGSNVKALCDQVRANNITDSTKQVKIIYTNNMIEAITSEEIQTLKSQLKTEKKYKVEAEYSETTKLIERITITE